MKIQTIFLIFLLGTCLGEEFLDLVCQGFVEFPSEHKLEGLDFSNLEIHLYT